MLVNFLSDTPQIVASCAESKLGWLIPLVSVVASVVTSLFVVYLSTRFAEKTAKDAEERSRRSRTEVLAATLSAEVRGLMHRYEMLGRLVEAAKNPQELKLGFSPPRFNFFIVFESCASQIGLLGRDDAADVVELHILAKSQFEDLVNWVVYPPQPGTDEKATRFATIKETQRELMALKERVLQNLSKY